MSFQTTALWICSNHTSRETPGSYFPGVCVKSCMWQGILSSQADQLWNVLYNVKVGVSAPAPGMTSPINRATQLPHRMSNMDTVVSAQEFPCWGHRTLIWLGDLSKTLMSSNLRAPKFSPVNKIYNFQCMGNIFCVEFEREPLKFHTNYITHTLKDIIFIHWHCKTS